MPLQKHENLDWRSYQALGGELYRKKQYGEAIEALNKSLSLHESWQCYRNLGWALNYTQQYGQAIEAFNKSLAIHGTWQSYQGLGWALLKTQQYQSAIKAFKMAILLDESKNVESYHNLGRLLEWQSQGEKEIRLWQIYYRGGRANPHKKIDPLLGERSGVPVARDLIRDITKNLSRIQFAFYPSYYSEEPENKQLQPWKHLTFIHIPKCAGKNFQTTLSSLIRHIELKSEVGIGRLDSKLKHYLWHDNELGSRSRHDAYLLEAFQGKKLNDLQGSFLSVHGSKYGVYSQKLREAGITTKNICLVRNPSKRLYSHIRHLGRQHCSKGDLIRACAAETFNLIDKYIYDYDVFDGYKESPYCEPTNYDNCAAIDFFDISDELAISKAKSSFLSATLLPNIVQYNRLNDDHDKTKGALEERDFQLIHQELISRGFLERDNRIDLGFLKKRTKERLVFPEIIYKGTVLHPVTFIYSRNGVAKIIPTKDFIADPLSALNSQN